MIVADLSATCMVAGSKEFYRPHPLATALSEDCGQKGGGVLDLEACNTCFD